MLTIPEISGISFTIPNVFDILIIPKVSNIKIPNSSWFINNSKQFPTYWHFQTSNSSQIRQIPKNNNSQFQKCYLSHYLFLTSTLSIEVPKYPPPLKQIQCSQNKSIKILAVASNLTAFSTRKQAGGIGGFNLIGRGRGLRRVNNPFLLVIPKICLQGMQT